jgi:hypothetical protein
VKITVFGPRGSITKTYKPLQLLGKDRNMLNYIRDRIRISQQEAYNRAVENIASKVWFDVVLEVDNGVLDNTQDRIVEETFVRTCQNVKD